MKSTTQEKVLYVGVPTLVFGLFIVLWMFQSSIERDVWNKCHPTHQLTLWETMWSTTRIDNCER